MRLGTGMPLRLGRFFSLWELLNQAPRWPRVGRRSEGRGTNPCGGGKADVAPTWARRCNENLLSKVNRETEKKLESRQPCPNTEKSVQQTHRRREELRNRKKFSPSKRAGYTFFSNPARSSRCKQRWRLTSGSKNLGTETSVSTVRKSPLHVRSRCAGICSDRQSLQLSWIFLQLPFYKYRNKQGSLVVSGA